MTDLFSEVVHQMPIQLVEPIERMINRDIRYRLTVQQFMMVSFLAFIILSCRKYSISK